MKKLILTGITALLLIAGCKKDETKPQAASTTTTPPTASAQKWDYKYNYKKAGDPTEYTAYTCCTDADMAALKASINAYNVVRYGKC